MNAKIIDISDRIARNVEITNADLKTLRGYIYKSNKWKKWNWEDVLSNFVLDIRENYNPDIDTKAKEAWIYAHIKKAITQQARFDTGTLYNPMPIPTCWYEIESHTWPADELQIELEEEELKEILNILHSPLEKDLYINCILWKTPVAYIAKEHWKSSQRWKIIKDRISKRIKEYIENKSK